MKSFFDKLTGSVNIDDNDDNFDLEISEGDSQQPSENWEEEDGELSVDVYDEGDKIILKTMVAGVRPEDLDVSITRDMVTIKGVRQEESSVNKENYYHKELYWGSFSRTVMLPAEVDIEESKATEKHGLLILELPKIDKERRTKLHIKN